MGLSETVWEMQEEINQLRADRDKWKRLYETVVVKDEGMQLYEEIERLKVEVNWVRGVLAEHGYDGPLGEAVCPLREMLQATK